MSDWEHWLLNRSSLIICCCLFIQVSLCLMCFKFLRSITAQNQAWSCSFTWGAYLNHYMLRLEAQTYSMKNVYIHWNDRGMMRAGEIPHQRQRMWCWFISTSASEIYHHCNHCRKKKKKSRAPLSHAVFYLLTFVLFLCFYRQHQTFQWVLFTTFKLLWTSLFVFLSVHSLIWCCLLSSWNNWNKKHVIVLNNVHIVIKIKTLWLCFWLIFD